MNAELKKKHEELEGLRIRTRKILDEHKTHIPAEEMKALDLIKEKAESLRSEIASVAAIEEKQRDLADLDRYLDDPVHKIPHGSNGSDSERKSFEQAGWEFKGGMAYRQTSQGKSVEMFDQNVILGEIPDEIKRDPVAAEFYRTTRAAMSHEYKSAYAHLVRSTAKYGAAAMSMLSGAEQKALSEGTDTAGGFIVPPDIQAEMLVRVAQMAVIRKYARVQATNRDVLRFPAVKANSATYGDSAISGASILSSGFVGSWAGETPAFSDTDASFQTLDIAVKKLRVATRLSNDFVSDAAVNILSFLSQNGAENMALVEDQGFIQGNGGALQPMGILDAGISTVSIEGSTADTISNTSSANGSANKLISLAYTLPPQYVAGARWVMSRNSEGKIRQLVDGNNRYLWPPYVESAFAGQQPTLLGFPVSQSDWVPNDGQDTVPVVILGDLSHYIIAQRTQITSLVLRERFADTDQVGIILFQRVGGSLYNTDAFRNGIC